MSSRAGAAEDTAAATLKARDPSVERKPVDSAMRLVVQPPVVQQLSRVGGTELAATQNVLKTNMLGSIKSSALSSSSFQHLSTSVVLGISQGNAVFARSSVPLVPPQNLVPRVPAQVNVSKADMGPVMPSHPTGGGGLSNLYRHVSPGAVINLSQRSHSVSSCPPPSPLVSSLGPSGLAAVGAQCGAIAVGRTGPVGTHAGATRPVTVQALSVPTQIRVSHPQSQPLSLPSSVLAPRGVSSLSVRVPMAEQPKTTVSTHGHVPRGAAAAAIVLATPRPGANVALPRPSHLSVAPGGHLSLSTLQPYPLLSASIAASAGGPLAAIASRPLSQRPASPALSLITTQQSNRPSQAWTIQGQSPVAVAPLCTSSALLLPAASQPAQRPLAFAQPIRPQQLALVNQKTLLSPMTTASLSKPADIISQNVQHTVNRLSAPGIAQAAHFGSIPVVGQSQALNMSAPKSQKIVLAHAQVSRINVTASPNAVNLSKTGHMTSPLNLTRQPKNLKPQPAGPTSVSLLSAYNTTPLALTTSKSSGGVVSTVTSSLITSPISSIANIAKAVTVVPGSLAHQAPSFAPQVTAVSASLPSSQGQAVRLTAQNAVILGPYGLTAAHSGSSTLPVTLQPVLQTVDARQLAERTPSSQPLFGSYATQVVAFSGGVELQVQRPSVAGVPVCLLASHPHVVPPCCTQSAVPRTSTPALVSVVTSGHQVMLPLAPQFSAVFDPSSRLMSEGSVHPSQPTVVALNFNKAPVTLSRQQPLPVSETVVTAPQSLTSPRPGILRKRAYEATAPRPSVKRNLQGILGERTTVSSGLPSSEVNSVLPQSPKLLDGSRENSRSSTDTAASSDDSPPAVDRTVAVGRHELHDTTNVDAKGDDGSHTASFRSIPRKKPRKQALRVTEEVHHGFSSDDEDMPESQGDFLSSGLPIGPDGNSADSNLDDTLHDSPMLAEYVDEEGVRFTLDGPSSSSNAVSILGSYHCGWKPRNNHFVGHADFKVKEERRPTVNELANQKGIGQRATGWKVHMLSSEFEALAKADGDVHEELSLLRDTFSSKKPASTTRLMTASRGDDSIRIINELVQGNIQRCQHYVEQLGEAKSLLLRFVEERRPHALEIIARHQSKRAVKKKERL